MNKGTKWINKLVLALCPLLLLAGCAKEYVPTEEDVANSKKISEVAKSSMIDAATLKSLVDSGDENLVIVGVLDSTKGLIPGNIASKPIDGSYLMWRPDYSGEGSAEALAPAVGGFRKSAEQMGELLEKAGATTESTIVVYSAESMHDAARVWWQLKLIGHDDVRYLDGGLNGWIEAGYPTGKGKKLASETKKSDYAPANLSDQYNVNTEQVLAALDNPDEWVVIDTRSAEEYAGQSTGSSKGAFGTGRMLGALPIEWSQAVDGSTKKLKSIEELQAIYGDAINGKKVIAFCQSGVRSGHTYFVLKEILGATEVYNYDGSWIEWSYAASEASNGIIDDAIKSSVISKTELFTDNKKPI